MSDDTDIDLSQDGEDEARTLAFGGRPPRSACVAYLACLWLMARGVPGGGDDRTDLTADGALRTAEGFAALDWLRRTAEGSTSVSQMSVADVIGWAKHRDWLPEEKRQLIDVIESGLEL